MDHIGRAPLLLAAAALLVRLQPAEGQGAPHGGGGGGGGFHPGGGGYTPYVPHGGGGGGGSGDGTAFWITLLIVGGVAVLTLLLYACASACQRALHSPVSARDFVRGAASGAPAAVAAADQAPPFPSGLWRGYYSQFGQQHAVCDFRFEFQAGRDGVEGEGVDDVGHYVVQGVFSRDRVAFSKRYTLGSRSASGRVNSQMNMGHTVEYRGERVGPSLGLGIRGTWYISNAARSGYRGKGAFHLWPAMPDWHSLQPSAPQEDGQPTETPTPTAPPPEVFEVTRDHVCVVCFENPIDTCLQPCRHAAVCRRCAAALRPADCPICRAHIAGVLGCDGRQADAQAVAGQALRLDRERDGMAAQLISAV